MNNDMSAAEEIELHSLRRQLEGDSHTNYIENPPRIVRDKLVFLLRGSNSRSGQSDNGALS